MSEKRRKNNKKKNSPKKANAKPVTPANDNAKAASDSATKSGGGMSKFRIFRLFAIFFMFLAYQMSRPSSPPRSVPHQSIVLDDFISDDQHKELMTMFEELNTFPTASQDWTSTKYHSIGEDYEPNANGKCTQLYTQLNNDTGKCQFPQRIDIARHYVKTGGYNGLKESYNKILHRLNPFINYQFDAYKRKEFVDLFEATEFQAAVSSICGPVNPHFKPFQLSLILNMNGNSVPQHLDIPFFFTATRFQFPQWLLLVMQDSGLFKAQRLPQVQALVYVHDWETDDDGSYDSKGGEFITYPQGPEYKAVPITAKPKTAIFCDGSEQVHGTSIFKPDERPYYMDKDLVNEMRWDKDYNIWRLYTDNKPTQETYTWQNIRASIAYRGWCFSDEDLMNAYDPTEWSADLDLNDIMDILKRDLINNKKKTTHDKWEKLTPYQRGTLLLDSYINLPKPTLSKIPWNYCVLFKLLPEMGIIQTIENFIC